jgi:hypothetical protein
MPTADRHVVFVVPFFMAATLRFVGGAAQLAGARLSIISQEPLERLPAEIRNRLLGHWRIDNCFDPAQLVVAVRGLSQRFGPVDRLFGSLEQLQVPLAEARQVLSLPGLDIDTANNFRDKNRMKDCLQRAGLPCARHALAGSAGVARQFAAAAGFPLVVKPPAGAGARNTFRVNSAAQLEQWLAQDAPRESQPVLLEEYLQGEEFSFDSIMIGGKVVWHSISCYRPAPLTVLENPWIQWCVLLPRRIDGAEFDAIRRAGPEALSVLGLETGMTHMEWFRRPDGSIAISEVAARPPGAQFTSLISFACDLDFYRAWPVLQVFDRFESPQREYAAGAAYLRGMGEGRIKAVHGVEQLKREFGPIMVDAWWPVPGAIQPAGYEGSGYVIYRHPETEAVEHALRRTVEIVRVELG